MFLIHKKTVTTLHIKQTQFVRALNKDIIFTNISFFFSKVTRNQNILKNLLQTFYKLGYNTSTKVHFLHSHLDYFFENSGAVIEKFYQDI